MGYLRLGRGFGRVLDRHLHPEQMVMTQHLRDFYWACAIAAVLALAGFAFAFLR
jgi:hypothetical protein